MATQRWASGRVRASMWSHPASPVLVEEATRGSPATSLSLIPATVIGADSSATAPITVRLPNKIAIDIANASPSLVAAIVTELTRSQP